jgi:hypothetical protein
MLNRVHALTFALAIMATPAMADQMTTRAAVGGGLGAALGAFIGGELGGRNAAILGSGLGGAVATAIATEGYGKQPYYNRQQVSYPCPPGQWENGRCR